MSSRAPSNRSRFLSLLLLIAAIALVWLLRGRIHFDWHALGRQLRSVSALHIAAGIGLVYFSYGLRAWRWAVLVTPARRTRAREVLGAQFIGFTAIALLGRLVDLVRPYVTARRLALPVAGQIAVYSLERAFDLGAAATLFSVTLAVAPHNLPHHAAYVRAGALSLAATLGIAAFAAALRIAGDRVSAWVRRILHPFNARIADLVAERLLDFRKGLRALTSLKEFLGVAAISLVMWIGIALGYTMSARSFAGDPVLAHFSFMATVLLLATSLGGSLLQLPVLGWFSQIAVLAAALDEFFGVPLETATACAAVILFVMSLSVIPAGLIAARVEGVSFRSALKQSEEVRDKES